MAGMNEVCERPALPRRSGRWCWEGGGGGGSEGEGKGKDLGEVLLSKGMRGCLRRCWEGGLVVRRGCAW